MKARKFFKNVALTIATTFTMASCAPSFEDTNKEATEKFDKMGYEVISDMGTQAMLGQRAIQYIVKKKGDNSEDPVVYTATYADAIGGKSIIDFKQVNRLSDVNGLTP